MKNSENKTAQMLYKLGDWAFVLGIMYELFGLADEYEQLVSKDATSIVYYLIIYLAVGVFGALLLRSLLHGFAWLVYNSQFLKPTPSAQNSPDLNTQKPE